MVLHFEQLLSYKNAKNKKSTVTPVRAVVTAILSVVLPANCNKIIAHSGENVNRRHL